MSSFPVYECFVNFFAFPLSKDTVAKKCEYDEEDREGHALVDSALRFDAIVHHHVPVLAGQDLAHTHTDINILRGPSHSM